MWSYLPKEVINQKNGAETKEYVMQGSRKVHRISA
jgi:hypothetical protein